MKKLLFLITAILLHLSAMAAIDPVAPTEGDGSSSNPYKIGSPGNLVWFAEQVNGGNNAIYGTLTANIDLGDDQTMIGTEENKYKGTFDGDGHTITINYHATKEETGLFLNIEGATIKNLKTAGKISTGYRYVGGIVCESRDSYIERCASSVTIESSIPGEASHGGIVSCCGGANYLTDVLFNGKLLGYSTNGSGGLVGFSLGSVTITGCWFNPSEMTFGSQGSATLANGTGVSVINSYYSKRLGNTQGTATTPETLASGEVCCKLNGGKTDGTQAWYQNLEGSSKDVTPVLDKTHGTVYGDDDQCPTYNYSNTHTGHTFGEYNQYGERTCSACSYIDYQKPTQDASGAYLISNRANLIRFAQQVNNGYTDVNGTLTASIDLGEFQTMIGTSKNMYKGTFDGGGNTVTVNYTATEDNTALFRYVEGATINNLQTAGSIETGYQFAGGIVAECSGTTYINNCSSSITITSTFASAKDGTHGGIVGCNNNMLYMANILFNGKLLGENAKNCGGLVGWSKSSTTISNSLFCPSEVTFAATDSKTLSRGNNIAVINSYYSVTLGEAQGTATTTEELASGEICFKLNSEKQDGTQAWYQNIDGSQKDASPVLDKTHGIVYSGENQCPAGSYSNTNKAHTFSGDYVDGKRTCSVCSYIDYADPNQDASGAYLIGSKKQLIWFAQQVNGGNNNINGKLIADIDLGYDQTMIGTSDNKYKGTFDGDGHTITVNYTATEDNTGLFRFVYKATIRNLITKGCITTEYHNAGGIIGNSDGSTNIGRCVSSVSIISTVATKESVHHGGFVGRNSDFCSLTESIFVGKLYGPNAVDINGLIGFTQNGAWISDCLVFPSEVTTKTTASNAFSIGSNVHVNNCYYNTTLVGTLGTAVTAEAIASGEVCYKLNKEKTDGTQAWYQNLDNGDPDATPLPFNTHGTVYSGENQCPIGSYSNSLHGHTFGEWDKDAIAHCTNSGCTAVNYQPANQDASDTYLIANKSNLAWFAQYVNKGNTGINGKLTADIDLGNIQAMIGTNKYKYAGTFDGDGYTVTVNYTAAEDVTALFRYVQNGTIKNLMTAGTINTAKRNAAGVAGICNGITLEKVVSSVVINSSYVGNATHAGLVAESYTNVSSLTDCAFIGQLLGSNTTNCAGLVGYHGSGTLSLTNCYVAPSADYTVSTTDSKTLVRKGNPAITNCYYTKTLGDAQGEETTDEAVADGSLVNKLGSSVWSQNPMLNVPVPFFLKSILSKYLKFTAQGDGTITVNKNGTVAATLEYFTEETKQWTDLAYNSPISLSEGKSIWMRAKGTNGKNATLNNSGNNYLTFTSTMNVAASQNIMSLLDASCEQTEVPSYAFQNLFSGWTYLTQAPELPGTELNDYCYASMFEGCTGLTSIPDLSNANLANNAIRACYNMFLKCSKLKVNTLGLGSEWQIQMEDTRTTTMNNFYNMFAFTGGNFKGTPEKDVTYYVYNDEPYTRSMPYKWGTVALPFDVAYDAENINHKLYHLSAADSEYLTFTEYATGTISAGTPMVVKAIGEKGGDGNYTISIPSAKGSFSGTITAQNKSNAGLPEGWTMNATYTDKTIQATTSNSVYYISDDKFWYADGETLVPAFRGWFECPSSAAGAKIFNIVIDGNGETTSILNAESIKQNESDAVYNLAGQRVNNSAKGLLIINGKKVYRK